MTTPASVRRLGWHDVRMAVRRLVDRHRHEMGSFVAVFGVPAGGACPAVMVHAAVPGLDIATGPGPGVLVVDDLVDSGATLRPYVNAGYTVDALFRKPYSPVDIAPDADPVSGWAVFPWERETAPESAVARLLQWVGQDTHRDGLRDTPGRVIRALTEMTAGYAVDVAEVLGRTFDEPAYDEMVVLRRIAFSSLCEHHLLPFVGTVDVGYIPHGRVVGLSKLARLVEAYARRLQLQERLTSEIATALMTHLKPLGAGVLVRAHHSCMGCRGVRKPDAEMVTSALLGAFRDDGRVRAEFLQLAGAMGRPA